MRFLVLGGGLQGTACAFDLLRHYDVAAVTVADVRGEPAPGLLPNDPRLEVRRLDFTDEATVLGAMEGHDVVASAAPWRFNAELARLAIRAGVHYTDLGGNTELVFRQLEMSEDAEAAGVTLVPDVGLAPGMVNVLAAEGIRRLDEPQSVMMYVGGLPRDPEPPLNYQLVYSLRGTLDYYTTPSWILREGELRQVDALSEVERIDFPGVGELEAFHTGGGASTLPWRYEGRVERLEYKTLRYPGHADLMRAIRDLGLLSGDPVEVDDTAVAPREVFLACVRPRLTRPEAPDLVALRVTVRGRRGSRPVTLLWTLLDRKDEETGVTAMMRCTGFTLAIVARMLATGDIRGPGVLPPDEAVPAERYLAAMAERGVRGEFEEREG